MLSKEKRLNLKKSFRWVRAGSVVGDESLKIFYRCGTQPRSLVGIAISSSVSSLATKRNRVRRLTSSVFESLYDELKTGLNVVAMPTNKVLQLSSSELTNKVKVLLEGKNLLNK